MKAQTSSNIVQTLLEYYVINAIHKNYYYVGLPIWLFLCTTNSKNLYTNRWSFATTKTLTVYFYGKILNLDANETSIELRQEINYKPTHQN